jgi:hypothetical protein
MGSGIRGVRMPYVMLGGVRMASVESARRWIAAVTSASEGRQPTRRTSRERDIDAAERNLLESGW